ncbi:MAG: trans-sulfuration enzyme family protein [Acidimicrobiia bacterium]
MSREERHQQPDTASVGAGHDPIGHLGSLKPPIYETSTFVFETAEQGKRLFEVVYGLDEPREDEEMGYIYSRLDSPNLAPAETRLAVWEEAEDAAIFNSGMAAITTVLLTFLRPGDLVLYSSPLYGGTTTLMNGLLADFGVVAHAFRPDAGLDDLEVLVGDDHLAMVYVETPANPTNDIFDIELAAGLADRHDARVVVDNTFLSPVWQKPLIHRADLVVHSATKYLGGHSDLTAGAVCGGADDIGALRHTRYRIGSTASPSTGWLLARSLETLRLRVERQTANATRLAEFLQSHHRVATVNHLSLLTPGDPRHDVYKRQCLGPGAMISFEVTGGEPEAFRFLNALEVVKLTVSLGGTESLASHPWSMSHSTVPEGEKPAIGVTPGLIRFSVGIEDVADLIGDLDQALGSI